MSKKRFPTENEKQPKLWQNRQRHWKKKKAPRIKKKTKVYSKAQKARLSQKESDGKQCKKNPNRITFV